MAPKQTSKLCDRARLLFFMKQISRSGHSNWGMKSFLSENRPIAKTKPSKTPDGVDRLGQANYANYSGTGRKVVPAAKRWPVGPEEYSNQETIMLHMTRRELLKSAGAGAAALALTPLSTWAADEKKGFTLPELPYDYDAL